MKLFQRGIAVALGLTMALSASACNLVGVDKEKDLAQVVATVNGEEILKDEYQQALDSLVSQYQMYGMDPTSDASMMETLQTQTLDNLIRERVIMQKAAELELDKLSEEEQAEFDKTLQDEMDTYAENFRETATTELGTSATEEQIYTRMHELLDEDMESSGITREEYKEYQLDNKIWEKVQKSVTEPVEFSEEEAKAWYDEQMETQKAAVEENPTSYESEVQAGTAVYAPEGYFYVKQILVQPSEEAQTKVTELNTEVSTASTEMADLIADDKEANQAKIDELEAKIKDLKTQIETAKAETKAEAQEALDKAKAGEDFDALVTQYNDDTGMQQEPYKSTGYLVGPNTTSYVEQFQAAAVALTSIGAISDLVETDYGYHILKKVSEVTPGAVSFEDVKEMAMETGLEEKRADALTAAVEQWTEDAVIKRNTDKLTDNSDAYVEDGGSN